MAVGAQGVLFAWGKTKHSGDCAMYPQPVKDLSGWNITKMSCGPMSFGVVGDNKAITWGAGNCGQLGYGETQKSSAIPKIVDPLEGITILGVSCGAIHTLFLVEDSESTKKLPNFPKICPTCQKSELLEDCIKCNQCYMKFHKGCANPKKAKTPGGVWVCEGCKEEEDEKEDFCKICKKETDGEDEENVVLICDGCEGEFHMKCVKPVVEEVPEGDWFCGDCQEEKQPEKKKRKTKK